jgi:hypothetical protein
VAHQMSACGHRSNRQSRSGRRPRQPTAEDAILLDHCGPAEFPCPIRIRTVHPNHQSLSQINDPEPVCDRRGGAPAGDGKLAQNVGMNARRFRGNEQILRDLPIALASRD